MSSVNDSHKSANDDVAPLIISEASTGVLTKDKGNIFLSELKFYIQSWKIKRWSYHKIIAISLIFTRLSNSKFQMYRERKSYILPKVPAFRPM